MSYTVDKRNLDGRVILSEREVRIRLDFNEATGGEITKIKFDFQTV